MKASLEAKLAEMADRFEELAALLSDPEVIAEQSRFRDFSMEYARLDPVVQDYRAWLDNGSNLEAARQMTDDPDEGIRALGEEEATTLQEQRERLEEVLRRHLVPRDPRDDANIFLEIRAGTGGDEAALFAGDLFRMYLRYAEQQRWSVEILSASEGEHGGTTEVISRIEGRGA